MSKLSRLQYISQGETLQEQHNNIESALKSGVDWIQVRWKQATPEELFQLCRVAKKLCDDYGATCIVNDHYQLAKKLELHGVHLGLEDTPIAEARNYLGLGKIIGGTANTVEHVWQRIDEGCDYIGLGPLRFTTTKEKLSPILGVEGYSSLIKQIKTSLTDIRPIYAIGGIVLEDIEALRNVGVYGVAVSSLITKKPELTKKIQQLL